MQSSSPRRRGKPARTTSRRPRTTNRRRLAPASVARQLPRLTIEFQATRQRLGRGIVSDPSRRGTLASCVRRSTFSRRTRRCWEYCDGCSCRDSRILRGQRTRRWTCSRLRSRPRFVLSKRLARWRRSTVSARRSSASWTARRARRGLRRSRSRMCWGQCTASPGTPSSTTGRRTRCSTACSSVSAAYRSCCRSSMSKQRGGLMCHSPVSGCPAITWSPISVDRAAAARSVQRRRGSHWRCALGARASMVPARDRDADAQQPGPRVPAPR